MLQMKKTRSRHVKNLEAWDIPFYSSQVGVATMHPTAFTSQLTHFHHRKLLLDKS